MPPPVSVVASGGRPVTQVADSAPAFTVIAVLQPNEGDNQGPQGGAPITLVETGGAPAVLLNPDGSAYEA